MLLDSADRLEIAVPVWGDPGPWGTTLSPGGAAVWSVLILSTMLDKQSKLEMSDVLLLLLLLLLLQSLEKKQEKSVLVYLLLLVELKDQLKKNLVH